MQQTGSSSDGDKEEEAVERSEEAGPPKKRMKPHPVEFKKKNTCKLQKSKGMQGYARKGKSRCPFMAKVSYESPRVCKCVQKGRFGVCKSMQERRRGKDRHFHL